MKPAARSLFPCEAAGQTNRSHRSLRLGQV